MADEGVIGGAAQGAAAGSLGGPWGAVAGAGLGAVGSIVGGKGAKKAAASAGRAARQQGLLARQGYNRTAKMLEEPTMSALADLDKAINLQEKNLGRQEELISQIDPTIIEASQQALRLLRGESASVLNPLQSQRQQQRDKLVSTLREQLGSGAETSTAGMQALKRFDSETSNTLSNAQQSYLGQLGNTAGQFSSIKPSMSNELASFGNLALSRQGAAVNSANALQNSWNSVINAAGGNQVAAQMQGQYQQNLGNQLINAGTTLGAAYLTRGS